MHKSNKMRTKWEEGVRRNRQKRDFTVALLKEWERQGGWSTCPEYMHKLELDIKKQEQYLRNRGEL